jgi:hypothetical protein
MNPKQGHVCCGCCCDVRRAVIIVNTLNGILLFGGLIFVLIEKWQSTDGTTVRIPLRITDHPIQYNIMISISIVFGCISIIGIYGAMKLRIWMISLAATMYLIDTITGLINLDQQWDGVLIALLFFYPHLMLIREIRKGIISYDTYRSREEYSCCSCCVTKHSNVDLRSTTNTITNETYNDNIDNSNDDDDNDHDDVELSKANRDIDNDETKSIRSLV